MDTRHVQQVRRFNRVVTQRVGALEDSYLRRGRPLGEARLIFETGADGADVRALCATGSGWIPAISADSCGRLRHRGLCPSAGRPAMAADGG